MGTLYVSNIFFLSFWSTMCLLYVFVHQMHCYSYLRVQHTTATQESTQHAHNRNQTKILCITYLCLWKYLLVIHAIIFFCRVCFIFSLAVASSTCYFFLALQFYVPCTYMLELIVSLSVPVRLSLSVLFVFL